ncbi:RHS repeat-associated core domain-containing protein [Actinophytocola sp. NPDC049390]|uniref:RHS repeat-associated core domain-containing protein n=1 Tax=Actinophytocola sp. NPDC049390 TaxID=3363894 RepID=UPI00378D05C5
MTGPGTELNRGSDIYEAAGKASQHILGGSWFTKTTVPPAMIGVLGLPMLPTVPLRMEPLLGFAVDLLQPVQDIIDDLAGDPGAIISFGDAWRRSGAMVAEAATFLDQRTEADLAEWEGEAADAYRGFADVRVDALMGIGVLNDTTGTLVVRVGEVVAGVRLHINDIVVALVDWLISTVVPALIAAGTYTSAIVAETTSVIMRVAAEVIRIVQALFATIAALGATIGEGMALLDAAMKELSGPGGGGAGKPGDPVEDPPKDPPDDPPDDGPGIDLGPLITFASELLAGLGGALAGLGSGLGGLGTALGAALAGLLAGVGTTTLLPEPESEPDSDPGPTPVPQPGGNPGPQPGERPGEKPGPDPGGDPGQQPGDEPGSQPGDQPGEKPGPNPDGDPGPQPGDNPGSQPGSQPGPNPGGQPGPNPGGQPGPNPGSQPGSQPGPSPGDQPGPNPGGQPGPNPGGQPGIEDGPQGDPDGESGPGGEPGSEPGDSEPGHDPDSWDGPAPSDEPLGDGADDGEHDTSTPPGDRPTEADPIDVVTGEMILAQRDIMLPGVLPLVLRRVHVSSYRHGVSYGRSWASTVDQRIDVADDRVVFASEDGMLLRYSSPEPGTDVLPERGPRLRLAVAGDEHVITDPATGRRLHFSGQNRIRPLRAITDGNDNRIDFLRDARGTLTEIRHSGGYRLSVRSDSGRITALRLGPDTVMTYGYDGAGRLTEVVNSSGTPMRFTYDANRITAWEDRNGSGNRYDYDETGRCVHTSGTDSFLDYRFAYDRENKVTTITDSLGNTKVYHYNSAGRVTREIDALGNATVSEWDAVGRMVARTDPLGRTTRRRFDGNGNPVEIVRPDGGVTTIDYADNGRPIAVTDPTGAVWRQEFDDRGNRVAESDPTGAVTRFDHDARGALSRVTDPLGNQLTIEANGAGLPVRVTGFGGETTRYDHDAFGRISSVVDSVGGVTRFGWTIEGRLAVRTRPDGATERWRYDGQGNQIEHVDPLGTVRRTDYTHFGLPTSAVDSDGTRLEYGYDTELRLTTVTNPAGLVWRYEYGPTGNLIRETDYNGRVTGYSYDAAGQLVEKVNGEGRRIHYVRDLLGNVVESRRDDGVTTFRYDAVGRLLAAANADSELSYRRDALGRVIAETCDGRTVTSTYDARGRRVHRRTPSGVDSAWDYGARSKPMALHTSGQTLRFDYDIAGREVRRTIGSAVTLAQQWDENNRLKVQHLTVRGEDPRGPAVLQRRSYGYRADGYLDAVVDQLTGARRYELDADGRVEATYHDLSYERYAYDASGNLANAELPGHSSDGGREYHGTLIRRSGLNRYRHDREGRLVLRQETTTASAPRIWRYEWNDDDRLTAVTTPDGQLWRYRYDPLGRRTAKLRIGPDGTQVERIDFVWDGPLLVEQTTATATTTWDWQPDGFRPLTQAERPAGGNDAAFYAIVTDLVGTPTELVDADGNVGLSGRTTLWGEPLRTHAPADRTPLRFPGQYFDVETGLHYNLNRYYDPANARFTSEDPLGLDPAPNPHAYVHNPLTWFDPLGLDPHDDGDPEFTPEEIKEIVKSEDNAAHRRAIDDAEQLAELAGKAGSAIDSIMKLAGKDTSFGDVGEWVARLGKYYWDRRG